MSVPVRPVGDRQRTNRAIIGQNYSDRIVVSAAISGRIIRVMSLDIDSIGRSSGTAQIAILNSGGSGSETIVYETPIQTVPEAVVADGYNVQQFPSREPMPLQVPVTVVQTLQNGQALVARTNIAGTSGLIGVTATYWSDDE